MNVFFEACRKKAEKDSLQIKLSELKKQESTLSDKILLLRDELEKENNDVEKLEKHTLSSLLYTVISKRKEKLEKEKNEAYAAKLKYENACRELEAVRSEIKTYVSKLSELNGCEAEYKNAFEQRLNELKSTENKHKEEIVTFEKEISDLTHQKKEAEEAKNISERAYSLTKEIISELEKAKSWSTYDIFGGGMFADLSKHEHLDNAQNLLESLQDSISVLKVELKDVNIDSDIYVRIDGFEKFADYFFDNFFTDISVNESICSSLTRIESIKYELERTSKKLEEIRTSADKSIDLKKKRIENLVKSSEE